MEIQKTTEMIYVVCNAHIATGGPELLHQLCHKLNKFGYQAKMFYCSNKAEDLIEPVNSQYIKYGNDYTLDIRELQDGIVIIPEGLIFLVNIIKCKKAVIWWLSVDNYFINIGGYEEGRNLDKFGLKEKDLLHLAQSHYAIDFLINKMNIEESRIRYLSDYLGSSFFEKQIDGNREDFIIFNARKGLDFTKKLIEKAPDLKWMALHNMTYEQVGVFMSKAKVYIDFGHHPGKDRMPREAAVNGCCIITNKDGSAAYYRDIPIPDQYKFDNQEQHIDAIIVLIRDILHNYAAHFKKFGKYRMMIRGEEKKFESDVQQVFNEIVN